MDNRNIEQTLHLLIKNVKSHYWEVVNNEPEFCEIQLGEGSLYESVLFRYNKYLKTFNIDKGNEECPLFEPIIIGSEEGKLCKELFDIVFVTLKNPKYTENDKASLADNSHWFILANFPVSVNKERSSFLSL